MVNTRDRLDELAGIWHVDGPHGTESVIDASAGISELVRYLNHATRDRRHYEYLSHVGQTVGTLAGAAYGLDQVLNQMANAVTAHVTSGALYDDAARDDPFAGMVKGERALTQLAEARKASRQRAVRLQQLSSTANGIGHRTEDTA
jgi:hypothetical protein